MPVALAITWNNGELEGGAVAIAALAKNTGSLRFVSGMTAEEKEGAQTAAGNRMPSGVVAITIVSPAPSAVASPQSLRIDGEAKTAEYYNINGENYFKIRDLAALLSGTANQFGVEYDKAARTIVVTTGAAYVPVGGELTVGGSDVSTVVLSDQTLRIDGVERALRAYNIGGYNFFRLQDLKLLGFDVAYDAASDTILVTTR